MRVDSEDRRLLIETLTKRLLSTLDPQELVTILNFLDRMRIRVQKTLPGGGSGEHKKNQT
jgi:hypothetical protein